MDLCEHSKNLLFSIYRRIRKGQLEYQRAHTIPFRTFQKFWCIGTINVLILSFLGFPVDTSKLFTLYSFYWDKLHHLILTLQFSPFIVHANGKHPRKQWMHYLITNISKIDNISCIICYSFLHSRFLNVNHNTTELALLLPNHHCQIWKPDDKHGIMFSNSGWGRWLLLSQCTHRVLAVCFGNTIKSAFCNWKHAELLF